MNREGLQISEPLLRTWWQETWLGAVPGYGIVYLVRKIGGVDDGTKYALKTQDIKKLCLVRLAANNIEPNESYSRRAWRLHSWLGYIIHSRHNRSCASYKVSTFETWSEQYSSQQTNQTKAKFRKNLIKFVTNNSPLCAKLKFCSLKIDNHLNWKNPADQMLQSDTCFRLSVLTHWNQFHPLSIHYESQNNCWEQIKKAW